MIYFDNAATTYPKPEEVYKILDEANRNAFNSGRGSYRVARKMNVLIDETRQKILEIGAIKRGNVIFTSSATTSLNNILFGLDLKKGDNVYISPFEHNSVVRPLEEIKSQIGINIEILPFSKSDWQIQEDKLNDLFAIKKPKAIILSQVSNVTGFILPYEEIFKLSSKYNSINIIDSSQSFGILNINHENINYIVFAGHKSLYANFGIAGYIKLKEDYLGKNIFGGTGSDTMNRKMPDEFPTGYEAGSLNIVGIAGLNKSIDWLMQTDISKKEKEITGYLIKELKKVDKIKLYLPKNTEKIFGIVSLSIEGYNSDDIGKILDDEYDIAVRTGFHCAPLIHEFIDSIEHNGTVRISLGYFNTKNDVDTLVLALKTM